MLAVRKSDLPANPWMWRDSRGARHNPKDMETRHLFNTLKMIWNNKMPPEARVGRPILYTFSGPYTDSYLKEAIRSIGKELASRSDITADQKRMLCYMMSWFDRIDVYLPGSS